MSTHINSEPKTPPFKKGQRVRHEAGLVFVVEQCALRVSHDRTRWVLDDAHGNRFYAKNCRLATDADSTDMERDAFNELAYNHADWSRKTFGADKVRGPIGPLKHLAKEVGEALAKPKDVMEYADCLLLVLDASRRAGFTSQRLVAAATAKLALNMEREWPTIQEADGAIEHVKPIDNSAPPAERVPGWQYDSAGKPLARRWRVPFGGGYIEQRAPGATCNVFLKGGTPNGTVDYDALENLEEIQMEREGLTATAKQRVDDTHGPRYETGEEIEAHDVVTVGNGRQTHNVRSYTHDHEWLIKVSGLGGVYRPNELTLVEKPAKARAVFGGGTSEGERPISTPLTRAQRAGVDPDFLGVSAVNGAAVHSAQTPTETFVANLTATFVKILRGWSYTEDGLDRLSKAFREALVRAMEENLVRVAGPATMDAAGYIKSLSDEVAWHREQAKQHATRIDELKEKQAEANAELVRMAKCVAASGKRSEELLKDREIIANHAKEFLSLVRSACAYLPGGDTLDELKSSESQNAL